MFHTELIPDWIWLLFAAGALSVFAARAYVRHRQAAFNRVAAQIRDRNIADYQAWHQQRDQAKPATPANPPKTDTSGN